MVSKLFGGKPTPDAPFLLGRNRVVAAGEDKRAVSADSLGGFDGFVSDAFVGDVFGEEQLGEWLAGYVADTLNSKHELTVGMSVVKHTMSLGG